MTKLKFLGANLNFLDKQGILELYLKNKSAFEGMIHIISINPENVVCMKQDKRFKEVVTEAQGCIADGIGIVVAARMLYKHSLVRVTGVDTLEYLLAHAGNQRMRAVLIGGRGDLANRIAECYKKRCLGFNITGIEGYKDIYNTTKAETEAIFDIVSTVKPHFVFVAFGSPWQEKWIEEHRQQFDGCIVMGVGGGFDFLSKSVVRAPILVRKLGFEWLFRLIQEPWRYKRQLYLLVYIKYVIQEYIAKIGLWNS